MICTDMDPLFVFILVWGDLYEDRQKGQLIIPKSVLNYTLNAYFAVSFFN